jgi:ABC-type sugar transport system substrate-binding protein
METSHRRGRAARRLRPAWPAAAAAACVVLAGCTGGTTATGPTGGGTGAVVPAMAPVTTVDAPGQAFTPPTGKRILVLMCSSAGEGCVNEGNEEKAVAESLGWTVDLVDGKFDPTVWNQAVKQAAQSGVDGIISISGDPNLMAEAMGIVAEKDIPFVLTNQAPADDDIAGIDAYVGPDPASGGEDIAEWIAADSGGAAHVLLIDAPGYYNIEKRTAAIADTLGADCPNCVVDTVDMSAATVGTTLSPLVTSRMQQNPDIDYVVAPDDCCVPFASQGVQQAGRAATTKVVSIGGFAAQLGGLRSGGAPLAADLATPNRYMAWMAVDSMARLLAGLPAERFREAPQRLWTTANVDQAPEDALRLGWNLDFDYKPTFQELWGVKR